MGDIKPSAEPSELVPPSLGTIREIFDEFNVCDVSDEICTRVLDVLYRHTCDVVEESRAVANHTGHTTIEEGDMKLAIESISDGLLFAPPHKEQLLAYAEKNSNPLPTIRVHHGLRLPTERNNLTAPNYTLAKQEIDTETSQQRVTRDSVGTREPTTGVPLVTATSTPQSHYRLSASGTTMGAPSTVRVIAPAGIATSMIRIQTVQNVAQLESASPLRAIPVATVGSTLTTVQRRFADIP
ncbi:hypothetical protein CRM22_005137 [Opisthorchis felineus]|uniref:Transcription initiation factor TFIID subunit 12 domain-containing protein n=1 Tax=Opisthorchis felineus TaxID=147828 RepID=A0A4S2LSM8_OPIFE|nr:hypothetical protein CRM22_005137 [Opisthorchis felineus]TGZ66811.1 hypothetical protein CRM22_005137 [Opisthorchis felineus]